MSVRATFTTNLYYLKRLRYHLHLNVSENQCLYDKQGINYTGTWNKAKGNKVCIPWSDEFVQKKGYTPDMFPDKRFPDNFCRNPREETGKYSRMPWCYVARAGDKPFESCTVLKPATKSLCRK